MARPVIIAAALSLLAAPIAAEDHPQMRAAERDLQSARSHLQAAARDYGGHRRAAMEHVGKALAEIHDGLAAGSGKKPAERGDQRTKDD